MLRSASEGALVAPGWRLSLCLNAAVPKLVQQIVPIGVMLGLYWVIVVLYWIVFGSYWGYLRVILGYVRVISGLYWGYTSWDPHLCNLGP